MTTTFARPKDRGSDEPVQRRPGGDDSVERDGRGRPRILIKCDRCSGSGRVPSEKVEGRLNKCQRCKGEGELKVSYTRVTTFIDALEDKEQLITWKARMTLIGVAMDPGFLENVLSMDPEDKEDKDTLNRRAEAAADLAGASDKADHGTLLHDHSELVDEGKDLPNDADPQDWLDIQGYAAATQPFLRIVHLEELVVNDRFKVAGTPDRVSSVREGVTLRAPDGYVFEDPKELIITDLKTGRVDLGGLKMCMQLGLYAWSKLYKQDGRRVRMGKVNKKWGIIMHLEPGSGAPQLYWADLTLGWEAVGIAQKVRSLRSRGKRLGLVAFDQDAITVAPAEAA